MKMKLRDKILLYLFFAILVLPSVVWWFISPNLPFENMDNRQLKKMPVLNSITMKQFPAGFEEYYADNLPFRAYGITIYSHILYRLTGTVESAKILFAKNGWLFYKSELDGDPIGDYKRVNQFSIEQLEKICKTLTDIQKYCKKRNCDFIFLIGPNKENIYTEYMPDSIIRTNYTPRTKQLINYLKANTDIKIIDPTAELVNAKKDNFVYYKNDTHWNDLGGYIASKLLLEKFGLKLPEISELQKEYYVKTGEEGRSGYDLANMSGVKDLLHETNEIRISGYNNFNVEERPAILEGGIRKYCKDAPKKEKIMMIRDSFAGYMIPVVSNYYQDSVYVIYYCFQKEMIDVERPNVFVFEVVERYFSTLIDNYDFEEKN